MKKNLMSALAMCFMASTAANAAVSVTATDTFDGHTYYLLSTDTWTASESFATTLGGHLVTVNDAAENNWLINTAFNGFGTQKSLWIGFERKLLDDSTSPFKWASGQAVTFTNWSSGEPNNASDVFGEHENYVHTYTNGTWNDLANSSGYSGSKYGVVEVSSVPEPEAYALLLAGLGLVGLVARRKQA